MYDKRGYVKRLRFASSPGGKGEGMNPAGSSPFSARDRGPGRGVVGPLRAGGLVGVVVRAPPARRPRPPWGRARGGARAAVPVAASATAAAVALAAQQHHLARA